MLKVDTPPREHAIYRCVRCDLDVYGHRRIKCSGCTLVYYCTKTCLIDHVDRHQDVCRLYTMCKNPEDVVLKVQECFVGTTLKITRLWIRFTDQKPIDQRVLRLIIVYNPEQIPLKSGNYESDQERLLGFEPNGMTPSLQQRIASDCQISGMISPIIDGETSYECFKKIRPAREVHRCAIC